MEIISVKVEMLSHFEGLSLPEHQTVWSSGLDLPAAEDMVIEKGERVLVPTGLKIAIPPGFEGQVRPRSGLSLKKGVIIPNSPGTIDADYRGELKVILWNLGEEAFAIKKGDRIAQLVIAPVVKVDFDIVEKLDNTNRNAGGFGHTG